MKSVMIDAALRRNAMRFRRLALALAVMVTAQPALAASLDDQRPRFGMAGKAYVRFALAGRNHAEPQLGLKLVASRQDRTSERFAVSPRVEAETFDLRFGPARRPALLFAGRPLTRTIDRPSFDGNGRRSGWRTAAFVVGGLVVAGAVAYAVIVHEAERTSD